MISIAGFIFLLVCVFGGYILAGGKMEIILLALPCAEISISIFLININPFTDVMILH